MDTAYNHWLSEEDASKHLGVSEKTLQHWREVGYLKPGTHWRSSSSSRYLPWKPKVIYHINWCKERIEYWRDRDVPLKDLAA